MHSICSSNCSQVQCDVRTVSAVKLTSAARAAVKEDNRCLQLPQAPRMLPILVLASQLSVPSRERLIHGKDAHELIQALPQLPDRHSCARSPRQADARLQGQPPQITTPALLLMHPLYMCISMDRTTNS